MKKLRSIVLLALCLSLLCTSALAHKGNTDSSGGHTNHATGEYHYHHGHPAHQHTGGVCPYDFQDNTKEQVGSNNQANTDPEESHPQDSSPGATSAPAQESEPDLTWIWGALLGLAAVSVFILPGIISVVKDKRMWKRRKAELTQKYGGKSARAVFAIPHGTWISDDGWPMSDGPGTYGSTYTFYVARNPRVFHRNANCIMHTYELNAALCAYLKPCTKCRPRLPDVMWFLENRVDIQDCKKLKIPIIWD